MASLLLITYGEDSGLLKLPNESIYLSEANAVPEN